MCSFQEDDIALLAIGRDSFAVVHEDFSCRIDSLSGHVFGIHHGRALVLSVDAQCGATYLSDGMKRLMPFRLREICDICYDSQTETSYSVQEDEVYATPLTGEIARMDHGSNETFGNYERLIANNRFVVASKYGLTAWDAKTLRLLVTITARTYQDAIFVSEELLCVLDTDGHVDLIELPTGRVREIAKLDGDGWFILCRTREGIAVLHGDLSDTYGTVVFPKQLPTRLISRGVLREYASIPGMDCIAYAGRGCDGLVVWNTSTGDIGHMPLPGIGYVNAMRWSERFRRLFVGGGDGEVIAVNISGT
jgi:hypothetical protein